MKRMILGVHGRGVGTKGEGSKGFVQIQVKGGKGIGAHLLMQKQIKTAL